METNWRELITKQMEIRGDEWCNLVNWAAKIPKVDYASKDDEFTIAIDPSWLDTKFDDGYGGSNGCRFTLWTRDRVYFPVVYDGSEWVGSVPRDPSDEANRHVGGE